MKRRANIPSKDRASLKEVRHELTLLLRSMELVMKSADNSDKVLEEFSSQGIDLTVEQIREFYHKHGVRMSRRASTAMKQYVEAMNTIGGRDRFIQKFEKWMPLLREMLLKSKKRSARR